MPAAITITAAGKDWPISMREISELRRLQRRHGTREIARHMAAMRIPIEIALAVLAGGPA
jgi:hypothetical protein